ncbi:MAG TPA: class I SAM-dependent methyltransferase [Solirubrobacteraceae bacterium]|jgi:O-methyltransferase involved in polyketide biosynthesis|nr:class I SAM-dependent methyltransferase [Solirubrobacteraceae bacterium]
MNPFARGPETISPTAHYTGYVWARHGLAPQSLTTTEGRVLYDGLRPLMALSGAVGAPTLESFLLVRHRIIDALLGEAIDQGRVGQVVEIAAGMSGRGHRFSERYGEQLTYVEADLPAMAARKRRALGPRPPAHRVVDIDALRERGPLSLHELAEGLDRARGVAVITEGLLNYLSPEQVASLWARIAQTLRGFPDGLYLSDLHLHTESGGAIASVFAAALGVFVRGRVHLHFASAAEAQAALIKAGFTHAVLHRPGDLADRVPGTDARGAGLVRVIEASSQEVT